MEIRNQTYGQFGRDLRSIHLVNFVLFAVEKVSNVSSPTHVILFPAKFIDLTSQFAQLSYSYNFKENMPVFDAARDFVALNVTSNTRRRLV